MTIHSTCQFSLPAAARQLFLVLLMAASCLLSTEHAAAQSPRSETIRVMTFNLWGGGDAGGEPLTQSAAVIRAVGADLVGIQEAHGIAPQGEPRPDHAAKLAKLLDWHHVDQGGRTAIISRYPIVDTTPNRWGAAVRLPSQRIVYLFNAHFASAPYQPYQLLKIPYGNGRLIDTADDAVREAQAARGKQVAAMLAEIGPLAADHPVFVTGDFNEPSHLDWTSAAAESKLCPLPVVWPTTTAVCDAGFFDAYRAIYPDPVKFPGRTWTTLTSIDDPKDRHDRIDFIFGNSLATPTTADVIGESTSHASIAIPRYPSDHRSVVAEFRLVPTSKVD